MISGCHSGGYEALYFAECNADYSGEIQLMFQRNMSLPSSGLECKLVKKPASLWDDSWLSAAIRLYIQEYRNLHISSTFMNWYALSIFWELVYISHGAPNSLLVRNSCPRKEIYSVHFAGLLDVHNILSAEASTSRQTEGHSFGDHLISWSVSVTRVSVIEASIVLCSVSLWLVWVNVLSACALNIWYFSIHLPD
jgi:hypothetical protein